MFGPSQPRDSFSTFARVYSLHLGKIMADSVLDS